jgi:PAS domain S-box-containing protein
MQSRTSEGSYRAVFDAIDDGFCVIQMEYDAHGAPVDYVFLQTNPAFERHTGLRDVVGKKMCSLVPELEAFWFEFYHSVVISGQPARTEYYASAMRRWFDAHATRFGAQENAQVAVVFKDITERKRYEQQREQLLARESAARAQAEVSGRLKDEFLATLSHELRTPLHAMLGWLHMLRSPNLTPERYERALATVERNAHAQAQLIEDLLDVSRILSGKLYISRDLVDLSEVLEGALEAARPSAERKAIKLEASIDARARVLGEAPRLQQVAGNLLNNALKFTPQGGHVQVTLQRTRDRVELTVTDSGQGITPEFLPHVFERFRQQDGGSSRAHGGLGLGLSIVQQLVALHGGEIGVNSEGSDRGATFRVSLPAAPPTAPHSEPPPPMRAPSGRPACPPVLHDLQVLVVDDEPDAQEMVREILEECGAQVRTTSSAAEAMRMIEERLPDVLVSDVGMPDEDGYTLVRRVRALPAARGGALPAIALTAYARAQDRQRALEAGFVAHLAKPIKPADLLTLIASFAPVRL